MLTVHWFVLRLLAGSIFVAFVDWQYFVVFFVALVDWQSVICALTGFVF